MPSIESAEQVNTDAEEMMHLSQELGVTGLPYFNLHAGHKVQACAANLSKIGTGSAMFLLPLSTHRCIVLQSECTCKLPANNIWPTLTSGQP